MHALATCIITMSTMCRYNLCDLNGDGVVSLGEINAWQQIQKALAGDPSVSILSAVLGMYAILRT